jgi:hypothetical protein
MKTLLHLAGLAARLYFCAAIVTCAVVLFPLVVVAGIFTRFSRGRA